MTRQLGAFGLRAQSARMQVRCKAIRPIHDLAIGVAPVALHDQRTVSDGGGDGFGDSRNGELHGISYGGRISAARRAAGRRWW